ncbi:uncharacterized protein LOC143159567 [Aptenodytes patagonicus]|uniref:uncharacterized protein LOC143159567 n=1 Tax=Aptenodytes patagonicus TaxID=9234 RepID=UPI003F9EF284
MKNFRLMPGCNTVMAPTPEKRERGWRARRTPCCSFLWPPGVILGADFGQPGSTTMAAALEASGSQCFVAPLKSLCLSRNSRKLILIPILLSSVAYISYYAQQ